MPISKRTLMWFEAVVAVVLCGVGVHILFIQSWVGEVAAVGKLVLGGIPLVGGLVLGVAAALLRLKGRLAWAGQFLILVIVLSVVVFFLVL